MHTDYETLRALDSDNSPTVPSMSDEEINALPVHQYKVVGAQRLVSRLSLQTFKSFSFLPGYSHIRIVCGSCGWMNFSP